VNPALTRTELVAWLRAHRDAVHGDPDEIVDRVERDARRRAAEAAWLHAKEYAQAEVARWRARSQGSHASEDCVAREVCHDFARELRQHEPHDEADGDEHRWLAPDTLRALGDEARGPVRSFLHDVVGEEEHRVWAEVVRFTNHRASTLVRDGVVSTVDGWDETPSYRETAAHVSEILAEDFEARAHPRPR
jgi:hypothetical protein